MILLDTNIIFEMMRKEPSEIVANWLDTLDVTKLFISTITIAEIAYGIHALPIGNRQRLIEDSFNKTIMAAFMHRVIPFDENAAYNYGKIMAKRKSLGRPLSVLDGQIAALAISQKMSLATRNTSDFSECHIDLINPFN
jgi:predicted nucleic acid-binding protein